jgi:hypothetical protein
MWLLVQEARDGENRAAAETAAAKWVLLPGH